jgi:cytochrome c oxidase subunit IV
MRTKWPSWTFTSMPQLMLHRMHAVWCHSSFVAALVLPPLLTLLALALLTVS